MSHNFHSYSTSKTAVCGHTFLCESYSCSMEILTPFEFKSYAALEIQNQMNEGVYCMQGDKRLNLTFIFIIKG